MNPVFHTHTALAEGVEDLAALVRRGLTSADAIEQRANSALTAYVGNPSALRLNLQEAVALARRIEFEQ